MMAWADADGSLRSERRCTLSDVGTACDTNRARAGNSTRWGVPGGVANEEQNEEESQLGLSANGWDVIALPSAEGATQAVIT
jgi:hypothetical protein